MPSAFVGIWSLEQKIAKALSFKWGVNRCLFDSNNSFEMVSYFIWVTLLDGKDNSILNHSKLSHLIHSKVVFIYFGC